MIVYQWINSVKLKRNVKHTDHVYFAPVHPHIIYQVLAYLKYHTEFHENISITKDLSNEDIFRFSNVNIDIQGEIVCY